MTTVTVITPWMNNVQLIPSYEQTVQGAQVIIIDNASATEQAQELQQMCGRLGGVYIRNASNHYFAAANNQARALATGDILLFLNNDTLSAPGWLDAVRKDVGNNMLCSPSRGVKFVDGQPLCYLEGWCLAGRRATWERIGWWDAARYALPYWDDNDVCFRASRLGIRLVKTLWSIQHLGGMTTRNTPEAQEAISKNEHVFKQRVRELWAASGGGR